MSAVPSKEAIRKEAADRRAALTSQVAVLSKAMALQFLMQVPVPPNAVVSSYWAIGDEADPQFLESELRRRGHRIVMPRVAGRNRPLDFHLWEAGAQLVRGGFGLSQPSPDWPKLDPDVLIVPMLAFDRAGYRVGYGAGYYDRSIRGLRAAKSITAAGFAFEVQEFPELPHLDHDERLDWIVTENRARRIR
ncbi:MAG TPA: 5-formyltetrahydrofolate cyclo-ligase [Micropepsaceae bacterium]|nr:5-formyltetrahydrofolate cyclo-ligase [Micropepsaceae bacterium]